MKRSRTIASRALVSALMVLALVKSPSVAAEAGPPTTSTAAIALPGGGWVLQEKRQLKVLDHLGAERASIPLRGEQLDARPLANGVLIAVLDEAIQRPVVMRVEAASTQPVRLPLPVPAFPIETMCLYRDGQALDHLFVVAESGQAEQWLLSGPEPRRLRSLALPAGTTHCRVDDGPGTLFASEEKLGLWAYGIASEELPVREPVALRAPHGPLKPPVGPVQPLGGGAVVALDSGGKRLHRFVRGASSWRLVGSEVVAPAADQLAAVPGAGHAQVWSRVEDRPGWRSRRVPVSAAKQRLAQLPVVLPVVETTPVARIGDAADDPAIWLHATDPQRSLVLATNKKQGLLVYDLAGKEQQLIESGRINNVDVRQGVALAERRWDIAVATQRDDAGLVIYVIDPDGRVNERGRVPTTLKDIYGMCLYQPATGGLEVFANDKDGTFSQIRLEYAGERFSGREVRRLKVATQPEGCVVDDRDDRLFLGEEGRGVWTGNARASAAPTLTLVMPVGPNLVADVEGIALYRERDDQAGFLVVSSQGNSSYVVLDARPPFRYRGAFRIGINAAAGIDAVSETDGLDVTSRPLGPAFPKGMLVVQDGFKRMPDAPQNFKYVSWTDIAAALRLPP